MATGLKIRRFLLLAFTMASAISAFRFGHFLTYKDVRRDPAGLDRNFDFSGLATVEANRAIKNRLVEGAKLIQNSKAQGFELGAFYSKDPGGQTYFVCDQYQEVQMTFIAGGMSVSGEAPKLKVSGPCLSSEYDQKIVALMIPFQKIQKLPVRDTQLKDGLLHIDLRNVSDTWPHIWILEDVRLVSSQNEEIFIGRDEIKNISGKNLSIELPL